MCQTDKRYSCVGLCVGICVSERVLVYRFTESTLQHLVDQYCAYVWCVYPLEDMSACTIDLVLGISRWVVRDSSRLQLYMSLSSYLCDGTRNVNMCVVGSKTFQHCLPNKKSAAKNIPKFWRVWCSWIGIKVLPEKNPWIKPPHSAGSSNLENLRGLVSWSGLKNLHVQVFERHVCEPSGQHVAVHGPIVFSEVSEKDERVREMKWKS